jgi:uncharacterized protein with ParB-like and HNH nuclease domain
MGADLLGARVQPERIMAAGRRRKIFFILKIISMNLLSIDYGTKRVGLAYSFDGFISTLPAIKNDQDIFSRLQMIIKDYSIERVFVGLSEGKFAEETKNTLLVNQYKKGLDYYKLLPTQVDREDFIGLIQNKKQEDESQINKAYNFFERKLSRCKIEKQTLKQIIINYFSIVSIVLNKDDNPYLVFESLNAKGKPLTSADLIRNYLFMRIHVDKQQSVYDELWNPMEETLDSNLPEFIRHYLMHEGADIKQNDKY